MVSRADNSSCEEESGATARCHVYRRRWLMLALFMLCAAANNMQWLQYSIIANIMMRYYNVSNIAINWTAIVYEACYIPLVLPASWVMDRYGLRITLLAGCAIMVAGSWLKVLSVAPDTFHLAFTGQALVGTSQIFILGVPARLAAVWFGPDQVSTACSLAVISNQVGLAMGFLLPPAIVKNHINLEDIGSELMTLCLIEAAVPSAVFVLLLFFFQKEPPLPPSPAQAALNNADKGSRQTYLQTLWSLVTNKNYVLLLVSYGFNAGAWYVVSTFLNQMVLVYYEDAEEDAGRIGLTIVAVGALGAVTGGLVLDKTHKFKECTLVVNFMTLLGVLAFTFTLQLGHMWALYLTGGLLGFFTIGYVGIGFEYAAELTYPVPEGTSSGILNVSREVLGILFTVLAGELLNLYGDMVTNLAVVGLLAAGFVMTFFISGTDLRRQNAMKDITT